MSSQRTIKSPFSVNGKGLHTGLDITLTFNPAPENHGLKIKRIDLPNEPIIDALADYVNGTTRGTVLIKDTTEISTIEHALAALYALGIDNCLLEVNAPEFPILNGSSLFFVQEIEKVGITEQTAEKDYFYVKNKMEYIDENTGSSIVLLPDTKFSIDVHISYASQILSNQYASLNDLSEFKKEIADCRTFVFIREIEALLKQNLIKGGDLKNAIVIYDEILPQEEFNRIAELTNHSTMDANQLGYLSGELKFNNEPARHKLLDVIGDLALIGKPIMGKVIATKPGHKTNTTFAKQIRKEIKKQEIQAPLYTPETESVLDINGIKKLLPHRWPFLLIDKIISISKDKVVGVKNVTANETFFQGHFPEEPVMPGVLIIEAMAQTGGILALKNVEDPEKWSTYFMKIEEAKFRGKVIPGDTLVFRLDLIEPIRRGLVHMKATAFVGEKIVTEADLLAQIVKNK
ncbi:MAG: bifunctional UDP-3-O-[3-hydroxymyristoyl] N-acetylglucosamine deacetylase/3-hydroxyacyl-ACP dehydratase [Paludibacteraceae bacterium]|nr:bifunctional UDP-3-O-[3-hydroxymyristoyl] N-acetylglucosamine deacetylase/3-hydroxyacyl-ACP dehydratase [Paludibacteraceae bacterium]MBN2787707.1 bifunctional UDP-3-O-[3-hydroxymyristoyl] N-acetylglucosamine deacetylase/3-hydroxyacyl-ACP dehydratase [Paludibacteraceae bacterium]